ncbi:MAG: co-chaperone GroES [Candidatus Cloacimonetes bacterium]|nr:co-chaperone GroES [Candidatus Cloacimonadota bacterium]
MIRPIQDRILLEKTVAAQTMMNGLYIPDTAQEAPLSGKIIALGTDEEMLKVLKVGDIVIYTKYAGNEVDYEGVTYLLINFSDVLCVIE